MNINRKRGSLRSLTSTDNDNTLAKVLVSHCGTDGNPGAVSGPVRSLRAARDRAPQIDRAKVSGSEIILDGGTYPYEGNSDIFRRDIAVVREAAEQRKRDVDWDNADSQGSIVSVIGPPTEGPWVKECDHNCYWSDLGRLKANIRRFKGHRRPGCAARTDDGGCCRRSSGVSAIQPIQESN